MHLYAGSRSVSAAASKFTYFPRNAVHIILLFIMKMAVKRKRKLQMDSSETTPKRWKHTQIPLIKLNCLSSLLPSSDQTASCHPRADKKVFKKLKSFARQRCE